MASSLVIHVPTSQRMDVDLPPVTPQPEPKPSVWKLFFEMCLNERVWNPQFNSLASRLWSESSVGGWYLVNQLLDCQRADSLDGDPLISHYLEDLLATKRIILSDILNALLEHSRYRQHKPIREPKNSPDLETTLLSLVAKHLLLGSAQLPPHHGQKVIHVLCDWIRAINRPEQLMLDPNAPQLCDALGTLTISVLENSDVIAAIDGFCGTGKAVERTATW
jgi:hypothetical protein